MKMIKCKSCGKPFGTGKEPGETVTCPICSTAMVIPEKRRPRFAPRGKFPALKIIAIAIKLVCIILIVGIVFAAGIISGSTGSALVVIASIVAVGVASLILWAFAELIEVLLAIEENTRK